MHASAMPCCERSTPFWSVTFSSMPQGTVGAVLGGSIWSSGIIRERRWKEVTAVFSFPSTATNASFVLRKYYVSLLHHYEQIYFFKAQGWAPISADASQSPSITPVPSHGLAEPVLPSPESQPAGIQQQRISSADIFPGASPASSTASPVIGVIDGKFESGYLVTVTIGTEKLKAPTVHRRRRRKKSEIKKRDPAHPKPNRSGYNFFFAEQHARLKPLHPGKDREISRMIGELWTKLKENEKAVYQEKAVKDKERYRVEMEDYRERLKMGQIISDAVPIQQRLPHADVDMVEAEAKTEMEGGESPQTPENESSSGKTDSDDDDKTAEKEFDMETYPGVGVGVEGGECSNVVVVGMETSVEEETYESGKRVEKVGVESEESLENAMEKEK
ncbi:High mobility group B protein 15 [Vitis vinifera]|uniref:High mobility group B protein 15 n=1 Tax=Vitis vinifera TaxID=29760 RepID=A0A438I0Y4_VITVI|nr:High mobility group B protein 15 [Vitis vinifera]